MNEEEKQAIKNLFDATNDDLNYTQVDEINLESIKSPSMDLHRTPSIKLNDGTKVKIYVYPQPGVYAAGHHFVVMTDFYDKPLLYRMFEGKSAANDFKIQLEKYLFTPEWLIKK